MLLIGRGWYKRTCLARIRVRHRIEADGARAALALLLVHGARRERILLTLANFERDSELERLLLMRL